MNICKFPEISGKNSFLIDSAKTLNSDKRDTGPPRFERGSMGVFAVFYHIEAHEDVLATLRALFQNYDAIIVIVTIKAFHHQIRIIEHIMPSLKKG